MWVGRGGGVIRSIVEGAGFTQRRFFFGGGGRPTSLAVPISRN